MPAPSSSKSNSKIKNVKNTNTWFYLGIFLVILTGVLFLGWSFYQNKKENIGLNQPSTSTQNSSISSNSNSPKSVASLPTANDLLLAMTPDAVAHELNLSSVLIQQCSPVINVFEATPVGEAHCQVKIKISKKGGPVKQVTLLIHVVQNPDKTWRVIP